MSKDDLPQDDLVKEAEHLLELCKEKGLTIATAESCTGGLLAAALTEVSGSSHMFERGFVTYCNEAKADMLGVPMGLIEAHGAVSKPVALAMAEGALKHSLASLAVSVTGIAGPGGATAEKPVGLVHFAAQLRHQEPIHREQRFGDIGRGEVRRRAVVHAFAMLREIAEGYEPGKANRT